MQGGTDTSWRRMCRFRPPFVEVIRCRKKLPPNLAISCRFATTVQAPKNKTSEIEIFARLIRADQSDLSRELARYILKLGFEENDQNRMRELAERNQDGRLTSEKREELENYVKAGHLLALLHSKARRSLRAAKLS